MRIAREVQELAPTEKAQYYKKKWNEANVPMNEGEYAVQMVNHEPFYFITNQARVFSVLGKKYKELSQKNNISSGVEKITGSMRQLRVSLSIDKEQKRIPVSRLMAEYFDVSEFNPMQEETIEVHHKRSYDENKGKDNNLPDNLQKTGATVHQKIFTPIQKAVLTDEGLQLNNPKQFHQSMSQIHEANPDAAFMVLSRINSENGTVESVEGRMLTDQDIKELFSDEQMQEIQEMLRAASVAFMQQESERKRAMAEYIREHPDRVRIVNGEPIIINEEDNENGLEKEQKEEASA